MIAAISSLSCTPIRPARLHRETLPPTIGADEPRRFELGSSADGSTWMTAGETVGVRPMTPAGVLPARGGSCLIDGEVVLPRRPGSPSSMFCVPVRDDADGFLYALDPALNWVRPASGESR